MKHNPRNHILLIVLLAGTLLPLRTGAQTSIEHLYKTLTGDGERLCTDPATGNSIISYNCHEMYTPIGFIYHKQGDTTSVLYKCTEGVPPSGLTPSYDVKDIEIVGDYCYFCGTYYTYHYEYVANPDPFGSGNIQVLVTTETGYLGRFLMSAIATGANPMKIELFTLPRTKVLNKLVGFVNGGDDYLCLVGTTTLGPSCLATVKSDASGINYWLHIPPATETLTDLTLTGNHLITVSRFSNESYTFGLRAESLGGVVSLFASGTPLPLFPYLNKYNTFGVNTLPEPRPENPTRQPNDVEIRIARVEGANCAVVAYDCFGGAFDVDCFTDEYHTALFFADITGYNPIQNTPITVLNAQLVSERQREKRSLAGLACPYPYMTILFHKYLSSTGDALGEIQFPLWSAFGDVDNLTADIKDLQDMYYDIPNQKANFAGYMSTDGRILHFSQDVNVPEASCYSTRPKALSEEMKIPNVIISLTEIERSTDNSWMHILYRPPLKADYKISCETH